MIYGFNTKETPTLSQVGGKAKSLIETTKAGFKVPEGFVLSVDFFSGWISEIKSTPEWKAFIDTSSKKMCDALKIRASKVKFTSEQRNAINREMKNLEEKSLFAVRSSSPEEDLEDTSFAGQYETVLSVTEGSLEKAVVDAFVSMLDTRVVEYKKMNNIAIDNPRIAVIIQKQIASDVSGVAFSLNPNNNAYDEAVINASFGLGETIVAGLVSPDTYVVDKVEKEIIEKKINEKDIGLWLSDVGGTIEKNNREPKAQALTDSQIIKVAELAEACEKHIGEPMDIEWAIEKDELYLLQSRPITTYIPLFEELLTKPGEKKRFYLDVMVMTQGFDEPMSVLGLELWSDMLYEIKGGMFTSQVNGTAPALHGREYFSLTDVQKLVGSSSVKKFVSSYDGNVKKIFEEIDLDSHLPDEKPAGTEKYKSMMFKMVIGMLPGVMKGVFKGHEAVVSDYSVVADQIIEKAKSLNKEDDFKDNASQVSKLLLEVMGTISIMLSGMLSQLSIKKMFKGDDIEKEIIALAMDLEGNPTSAMGHLLFKMACYDEFQKIESRDEFVNKCKAREFTNDFLKDYDEFMDKYAVRGMREIDVASMRVYEDVGLLYDKLVDINIEDSQITTVKEKRQESYDKLLNAARAKGKEKKFVKAAKRYQGTFGYREHPKYLVVYTLAMLHNMCLEMAQEWVNEGRLEEPYQVFDLHIAEISRAQKDKNFDMMAAREKNLESYKKVEHVTNWPLVIDSRGKIYKPKLEIKDGDIAGDPIAPGKVIGKAKVLKSPYEKPLEPGEILIARNTEPSWTPIFINAAGVIMEIGGPLQHGGIIAREYGIPCVSGLIGIMDIVKDGDLLEVDGYNGIVKIIN